MASITYGYRRVVIATPYVAVFVEDLKNRIPKQYRTYDPHKREWTVFAPYVAQATTLVRDYFPDVEVNGDDPGVEDDQRRQRDAEERRQAQEEARRRRQEQDRQDPRYSGFFYGRGGQAGQGYRSDTTGSPRTADPDDPYTILCVTRNAPPEVITAAYKALARLYHPDTGGDNAKMERLNVAYGKVKSK